jgi:hypothetical protein
MGYTLKEGAKPGRMDKTDWIKAWHQWFFSIEEKNHPSYSVSDYSVRSNDYNQGRIPSGDNWPSDAKNKVWFLAGIQGTSSKTRSIIPSGSWECILVPVYVMSASEDEFPKLSMDQLKDLVKKDVDGVNKEPNLFVATLDGSISLSNDIERMPIYEPFKIHNIPQENILGLDVDSTTMISDGYWIYLDLGTISPGDHILHIRGEAPNYISDTTYNLSVRADLSMTNYAKNIQSK